MKSNKILLKEQSNGDLMYVYRRKGSNPNRERDLIQTEKSIRC